MPWPPRSESVDRATGVWGIWMPGFCQFVSGIILFIGLTWLQMFTGSPPLYMAALAFSAYGIHWFALGWNRYRGNDARPNAGMCVAFMVISAMGATVFFKVGDWPVGLLYSVGSLAGGLVSRRQPIPDRRRGRDRAHLGPRRGCAPSRVPQPGRNLLCGR